MLVLANISAIRHQKNSEKHEISDITNYAFHIIHIHVHMYIHMYYVQVHVSFYLNGVQFPLLIECSGTTRCPTVNIEECRIKIRMTINDRM